MKTRITIDTHINDLKKWNWLGFREGDDFFFIEDDKMAEEAAKKWGVSLELVKEIKDALQLIADSVIDELEKDLKDIWEKINKY